MLKELKPGTCLTMNERRVHHMSRKPKKPYKYKSKDDPFGKYVRLTKFANRILVSDEKGNVVTPLYRTHRDIMDALIDDMVPYMRHSRRFKISGDWAEFVDSTKVDSRNMKGYLSFYDQVTFVETLREAGVIPMLYKLEYIVDMLCRKSKNIPLEFQAWMQLFGKYSIHYAIKTRSDEREQWELLTDMLMAKDDLSIMRFFKNLIMLAGDVDYPCIRLNMSESLDVKLQAAENDESDMFLDADGDKLTVNQYDESYEIGNLSITDLYLTIHSRKDFERIKKIVKELMLKEYNGSNLVEYSTDYNTPNLPDYEELIKHAGDKNQIKDDDYDDHEDYDKEY